MDSRFFNKNPVDTTQPVNENKLGSGVAVDQPRPEESKAATPILFGVYDPGYLPVVKVEEHKDDNVTLDLLKTNEPTATQYLLLVRNSIRLSQESARNKELQVAGMFVFK